MKKIFGIGIERAKRDLAMFLQQFIPKPNKLTQSGTGDKKCLFEIDQKAFPSVDVKDLFKQERPFIRFLNEKKGVSGAIKDQGTFMF